MNAQITTSVKEKKNTRTRARRAGRAGNTVIKEKIKFNLPKSRGKSRPLRSTQRARRRVNGSSSRSIVGRLGVTDRLAVKGTEEMLHSLFIGETGISRGIAFGSDLTSLTKYKGVFDISLAAGDVMNLAICPTALTGSNFFAYNYGANPTDNPYATGAGITVGTVTGPFNPTNPSTGWRIVRFFLRCTPVTNALNQGGYAAAGHLPILYTGIPTGSTLTNGTTGAGYSFGDIENFEMFRTFSGLDSWVYQWYPNQQEVDVAASAVYAQSVSNGWSGLFSKFKCPNTAGVTWHFEWEVGIEYTPNTVFRPYVERKLPSTHPDALYFMNQFTSKHWIPAVLGTYQEHVAMIEAVDPVTHAYTSSYSVNNKIGSVSDYARAAIYEEPSFLSKGYDIIGEACDATERYTGINPCAYGKEFARGVGNYASKRMMRAVGYGQNPYMSATPITFG